MPIEQFPFEGSGVMTIAMDSNPLEKGIRGRFRHSSSASFLFAPLVRAWQYRELIRALVRRDLTQRFRDSYFGWVWAVLAPLAMLCVYMLVFSNVVSVPSSAAESTVSRGLSIFVALILFNLFAELISRAPTLLHEHVNFLKKSVFPADAIGWIAMLRALAYAGIGLGVMLVFQIASGSARLTAILLPILVAPFCLMMLGSIWFLAALGALTRDVSHLMITIVPVLIFATPVFYSVADLSPGTHILIYCNPLTPHIEMARQILLLGTVPDPLTYVLSFGISLGMFYGGYAFLTRYRDVVVDVL
jgi:lipopolysaccharide transport system permease protein